MAGLVPNEMVAALAPLHTNIQWLGKNPFQHDRNYVAFMIFTKDTQMEFPLNYRIIQPLEWRIASLIFTQLGRTTTPVSDLIREADNVSRILQAYKSLEGLSERDEARLAAARVRLDDATQALDLAGQIQFPGSLFTASQGVLKVGHIKTAKRGIFAAAHHIERGLSESTATQLGIPGYQYRLNRTTLKSVVNTFNLYYFAFYMEFVA